VTQQEKEILLLRAQGAAIIGMLQKIPAGDGKPILGPERWAAYEEEFRHQAQQLGVKIS